MRNSHPCSAIIPLCQKTKGSVKTSLENLLISDFLINRFDLESEKKNMNLEMMELWSVVVNI